MYTLKEIAQQLGITPSTARYYRDNYKEFLPTQRIEGKQHPLYEDNAVDVLKIIRDLTKKKKSREEIKKTLSEKYAPIYEGVEEEQSKDTAIEAQQPHNNASATMAHQQAFAALQSTEFTHSLLLEIKDQNELLKLKDQKISDLKEELAQQQQNHSELDDQLKMAHAEIEKFRKKGFFIRLTP